MKLVLDDKLKHRLIGLAVIISLGAIFAPAVMRKSSQHSENNFSVSVKLPPKPAMPDVSATDEKDMFKTIKVARVSVPAVSADKQLPELVKAESIKSDQIASADKETLVSNPTTDVKKGPVTIAVQESAKASVEKTITVAANQSKQTVVAAAKMAPKPVSKPATVVRSVKQVTAKANPRPAIKQEVYAVQLASFAKVTNAQALVNRLHSRGYKASFIKSVSRQGTVYKVYAGHSPRKNDVIKLKSQLANAMQLNGFVVTTGVS